MKLKLKLKLALLLATAGISFLSPRMDVTSTPTNVTIETESITTDNLYPSCGIVTSVTSTELEWTDFNGNIWVIVGDPEDWLVGDRIAVIMDDNGTPIIYDDECVKTKYCGWEY